MEWERSEAEACIDTLNRLPITLENVAERIDVSPRQLQRIFRSEGQTTFRDYVEHVRLSAVCADLVGTDRAIEEIALAHSYATPNYLFPVFKEKFGMTPSAYRKSHALSEAVSAHSTERKIIHEQKA